MYIKKMRLNFIINKLKDTNDRINEFNKYISSTKLNS